MRDGFLGRQPDDFGDLGRIRVKLPADQLGGPPPDCEPAISLALPLTCLTRPAATSSRPMKPPVVRVARANTKPMPCASINHRIIPPMRLQVLAEERFSCRGCADCCHPVGSAHRRPSSQ